MKKKILESKLISNIDVWTLLMASIDYIAGQHQMQTGEIFDFREFCCTELGMTNTDALEFLDVYGSDEYELEIEKEKETVMNKQTTNEATLASRIHDFIKNYNYYEYMDNTEIDETEIDTIENIENQLSNSESVKETIQYFKEVLECMDEDHDDREDVNEFINELKDILYNFEKENYIICISAVEDGYEYKLYDKSSCKLIAEDILETNMDLSNDEVLKYAIQNLDKEITKNKKVVIVKETLEREIEVDGSLTNDEAINHVEKMYKKEKIVLDYSDYTDTEYILKEEDLEK